LKLKNVLTGTVTEHACKGLFMAIGHQPNTAFLRGAVKLDEKGYIEVTPLDLTSVEGVFGCGDAVDPHYRQAITAAGSGCVAALDAERWLEARGLG